MRFSVEVPFPFSLLLAPACAARRAESCEIRGEIFPRLGSGDPKAGRIEREIRLVFMTIFRFGVAGPGLNAKTM